MEILKTWLKRTGALLTVVIFVQWLVLPACPCQLRAMFPSAELSAADIPSAQEGAMGPKAADHHGPRELCCCSDGAAEPLQMASSDVTAPTMLTVAATNLQIVCPKHLSVSGDRLKASGTDPPGGGVRLHLRLQVILV